MASLLPDWDTVMGILGSVNPMRKRGPEVKRYGGLEWKPYDPKEPLRAGDRVRTGEDTSGEVDFEGQKHFVRPDSMIEFDPPRMETPRRNFPIVSGEVDMREMMRRPRRR